MPPPSPSTGNRKEAKGRREKKVRRASMTRAIVSNRASSLNKGEVHCTGESVYKRGESASLVHSVPWPSSFIHMQVLSLCHTRFTSCGPSGQQRWLRWHPPPQATHNPPAPDPASLPRHRPCYNKSGWVSCARMAHAALGLASHEVCAAVRPSKAAASVRTQARRPTHPLSLTSASLRRGCSSSCQPSGAPTWRAGQSCRAGDESTGSTAPGPFAVPAPPGEGREEGRDTHGHSPTPPGACTPSCSAAPTGGRRAQLPRSPGTRSCCPRRRLICTSRPPAGPPPASCSFRMGSTECAGIISTGRRGGVRVQQPLSPGPHAAQQPSAWEREGADTYSFSISGAST